MSVRFGNWEFFDKKPAVAETVQNVAFSRQFWVCSAQKWQNLPFPWQKKARKRLDPKNAGRSVLRGCSELA